jgi:hypothetical protein
VTREQAIVYVQAMTTCAMIEMEGLKAENAHRLNRGAPPQNLSYEFEKIIEKYGIHHNGVLSLFQQAE